MLIFFIFFIKQINVKENWQKLSIYNTLTETFTVTSGSIYCRINMIIIQDEINMMFLSYYHIITNYPIYYIPPKILSIQFIPVMRWHSISPIFVTRAESLDNICFNINRKANKNLMSSFLFLNLGLDLLESFLYGLDIIYRLPYIQLSDPVVVNLKRSLHGKYIVASVILVLLIIRLR